MWMGGLQIHPIYFLSSLKTVKIVYWNPLRKGLTWVHFAPVMEVQSFLNDILFRTQGIGPFSIVMLLPLVFIINCPMF